MSFDPVPWFVGGGAEHSPEVARALAYAATSGAAGVVAPGDLKVTQLPTPGTDVRVAVGGCDIPNLYPGGSQQTYIGRASTVTDVSVTATGSGSGRTDLVIARIDDPQYGGATPPSVPDGPYVRIAIIENVTAGSTKLPAGIAYPAIVLARLTIPASTATIITSMITDLRKVARPRRQRVTDAVFSAGTYDITTETPAWYLIGTSRVIEVPEWATYATVRADLNGFAVKVGNVSGRVSVNFAALGVAGQEVGYDENWVATGGMSRNSYGIVGEIIIPAGIRGTSQTAKWYGNRSAASPGYLQMDTFTSLFVDIEFFEVAE